MLSPGNSQDSILKVNTSIAIDDTGVISNRENKLHGSFGETIVIFHPENSNLTQLIRAFQNELSQKFTLARQNLPQQAFTDDTGKIADNTGFAPLATPHTTIIAMRVIDAKDQESWDERLIQSYLYAKLTQYNSTVDESDNIQQLKAVILNNQHLDDILSKAPHSLLRKILTLDNNPIDLRHFILAQIHSSLLYAKIEEAIIEKIHHNHIVNLEIDSIILTGNGTLGIRWKPNNDLTMLRKALASIGGIAKHGDEIITTTIGYFPYCTENAKKEIHTALEEIIQHLVLNKSRILGNNEFQLDLYQSQLVKFSRNDLHPDYIHASTLVVGEHLATDIDDAEFPVELITHVSHFKSPTQPIRSKSKTRLNCLLFSVHPTIHRQIQPDIDPGIQPRLSQDPH